MANWRERLQDAFEDAGDDWSNVDSTTLSDKELDREFDPSWGGTEGDSFTVWTKTRVYFPACYDGSEWVASVSRHPDKVPTDHIGGG